MSGSLSDFENTRPPGSGNSDELLGRHVDRYASSMDTVWIQYGNVVSVDSME